MTGVKKIEKIKFELLSPSEIRKMAVTKIITPDTYHDDGYPIEMGLMDTRLGITEPGLRCGVCGGRVDSCPGHFGYIDLAQPVIHVGFVKYIKYILDRTCQKCGALLPREEIEKFVISRKRSKTGSEEPIKCVKCGAIKKKITLDKPTTFREEGKKLTPKDIRAMLERVGNPEYDNDKKDLSELGLAESVRPEWMILTALPIPPVNMRPTITLESGERSEDDLTHKLVDVIRINQRLQENIDGGAPQLILEDLWELLQYHITTYFDNQTSGIPPARHRSGRALKTIGQRLKGKEGRFRSNLSGKRVNFSSRTVISPDPNISINEVGVPMKVASQLTVPVIVTNYNIDEMRKLIKNTKTVNYIIRPDGKRIKVTDRNRKDISEKIGTGYVVERNLMDGDIVLFNRQPSLHRMSMMAHRVKVLPYKTFRLGLPVCPPYNADFDGDEMNLHVLQSIEARAEAQILMMVQEHILSPRFGGSIIGALHDHITGLFLLTHGETKFNKIEVSDLLSAIGYTDKMPKPMQNGYWTGKQIFSLVIPKDISMEYPASICRLCEKCKKTKCEYDAYVVIRKGNLIRGTIDGRSVGAFKGKLLDKIAMDYGSDEVRDFIDKITKLSIAVLTMKGFTIGIDDEDIPENAKKDIAQKLKNTEKNVEELIRKYRKGILEQMPGRSIEETLEVEIMRELANARDTAGKIAESYLGLDNPGVIMAVSGARGSMLNLSQMAGCIGQQSVRGERISRGYINRTLPHFCKGELGASSRGFVKSSYKSGLTPVEYFFHSVGGREGLVDTAVRTSRSGYMQRRLINALEDVKLMNDYTVRDTAGNIIQFRYGEDGVDPMKSVRGKSVNIDDIISSVIKIQPKVEIEKEEIKVVGEEEMGLPREIEMESEEVEKVEFEVEDIGE